MTTNKSFEVIVRRKIPYLTDFVYNLLIVCTIILLLLSIFFLPTEHQSDEMKTAYYILVVPNFVKTALLFFGAGFLSFLTLYRLLRMHKTAMLTFLSDKINIVGQRISMNILTEDVSKIFCMDAKNYKGESKQKMTIFFEQKSGKTIRIRLKNYLEVDEFMNKLILYKNIDFQFYDFIVNPSFDEEE